MTITEEERLRFAEYCRVMAHSNREMVKQMRMISGPVMDAAVAKYNKEADSLDTVAGILESTKSATVGGKG